MLADDFKVAPEGSSQVVVEGDAVVGDESPVEEVHDSEEEHGLVRPFVRAWIVTAEVVKAVQPGLTLLFCHRIFGWR
jgi:hypothetical protein